MSDYFLFVANLNATISRGCASSAISHLYSGTLAPNVGTPSRLATLRVATTTRHALVLDDLAIKVVLGLDNAAKEHPAVHAGVGALEAGVVRSTLSSSWRGCGTLLVSIGAPPCGTGSGVRHHLRAIPLSDSSQYTRLAHF